MIWPQFAEWILGLVSFFLPIVVIYLLWRYGIFARIGSVLVNLGMSHVVQTHLDRLTTQDSGELFVPQTWVNEHGRQSNSYSTSTPAPITYGLTPDEAEELCARWMRQLGVADARKTRSHKDGGIDVMSVRYVAQVKNYVGSVSAREMRELVGAAHTTRKKAIFFTSGTYTRAAVECADLNEIPLFVYDARRGTLTGANRYGQSARSGL